MKKDTKTTVKNKTKQQKPKHSVISDKLILSMLTGIYDNLNIKFEYNEPKLWEER